MNDVTLLTHFTISILIISKITSIREVSNSNKKNAINSQQKLLKNYVFIASITKSEYIFLT